MCCQMRRAAAAGRRTLPSITATHELVVPRSMPMTSLPVANLEALELQQCRGCLA